MKMSDPKQTLAEAYREKSAINKTESGKPLEGVFTAEDLCHIDFEKELSVPREYPFARGFYADMYRGHLWSRRELCGYGSQEEINKRIK